MRIAIWVLPLALLFAQRSPWAGLAAILAGWYVVKTSQAFSVGDTFIASEPFATFHAMDSLPWVPSFAALCSAACAEGGASGALFGWPIASAGLLGIAAACAAWSSKQFRLPAPLSMRRPLTLAAILTLIALLHYMPQEEGDEFAASSAAKPANSAAAAGNLDGAYNGVILFPEVSPTAVLIPPLPFLKKTLFSEKQSNPLSVPFFGVYWMYRWPLSRPPPDAHIVRGSPLSSVFRSVDRKNLSMEARQNFGTLIDLSCCSKIQLALRSADGPTTVALILTNTTLPGRPSQSLGEFSIASTLDRGLPVPMVLTFDIPRDPKIREFDEATILFNRKYATASAKVAIDRFVFVPRGF